MEEETASSKKSASAYSSEQITLAEDKDTNQSRENCNSPLSTESILSSINEECNKLSRENDIENDEDSQQKEDSNTSELQEVSQNGLASLNSSNDGQPDLQEPEQGNLSSCDDDAKEGGDSVEKAPTTSSKTSKDSNSDNDNETSSSKAMNKTSSEKEKENTDSGKEKSLTVDLNLESDVNDTHDSEDSQNKEEAFAETIAADVSEIECVSYQSSVKEDSNSSSVMETDSATTATQSNKENETEKSQDKNEKGIVKIKLRSLASLCEGDSVKDSTTPAFNVSQATNFEASGVAVGDIVQHSNIVESDESGVMHLKISNVVGGEDCITGLSVDESSDSLIPIQISSIASLIEPVSPEGIRTDKEAMLNSTQDSSNDAMTSQQDPVGDKSFNDSNNKRISNNEVAETTVNIFKSSLVVFHSCVLCKKRCICEFRMVCREDNETRVSFLCSTKCKSAAIAKLPENHLVQKPRLYFERICGMCGKDISNLPKGQTLSWQTREFCNKLCLADHIGEVARTCFNCKSNVRVLYMVKYCVRFGSDVHQFCCNTCLETFKTIIKVCSFCQKNLNLVNKVISPSNKEYCSNKCLKRAQRRDIGQINYKEENDCTVCLKKVINKFEFLHNGASTFLCSNPCLNVFKYVNQVKSVNCCLCARLLNAEETSKYFFNGKQLRVFCSESCFSVFVISARKIVTCHYCKVKKYSFDMISATLQDELEEYFCCSVCCLNFVDSPSKKTEVVPVESDASETAGAKAPIVTDGNSMASDTDSSAAATPILKNCNMCSKLEPAQFHMVMSDSTLRSFCTYVCATRYKCTFGFQVSGNIQQNDQDKAGGNVLQNKSSTMETQTNESTNKIATKTDLKDSKNLMRLLCPPFMSNKSTMCRPLQNTKGVQCKPHQWHKSTQTLDSSRPIIPVPIPVYVPTPMMMYSSPTPVPLVIPVPVPIPVFIPTGEKTTAELEGKIKSLLEEASKTNLLTVKAKEKEKEEKETEEKEKEQEEKQEQEEEEEEQAAARKRKLSNTDEGDEDKNEHMDTQNSEKAAIETEVDVISRIEDSLPKFMSVVKDTNEEEEEKLGLTNHKRKPSSSDGFSAKRRKLSGDADDECLDLSLGLSVWTAWVERKKREKEEDCAHLETDLSSMSSEALSDALIKFLGEMANLDTQFEADTLFYILLGLQKYLFEKGSTHCIFLEVNFSRFTSAFEMMVQRFFQVAAKPETKCLTGTRVTEEMLWEARQLGAHTPHVLINTLFYFNTKIFRLKTARDHLSMTFNHIAKEANPLPNAHDGSSAVTVYLKYSNEQNEKDEGTPTPPLMLENKNNPLRCPVKLYEFYLSKCPLAIRTEGSTYYVHPEETCLPDSPVWYSSESFELETLEKMLNRVLLIREVQEALFGV